jgi:hypothetical protein
MDIINYKRMLIKAIEKEFDHDGRSNFDITGDEILRIFLAVRVGKLPAFMESENDIKARFNEQYE